MLAGGNQVWLEQDEHLVGRQALTGPGGEQ
jgi:hypothetical protein